jgi:hypothetical protein
VKVLLIGGKGSMGKRYQAILKMMDKDAIIYDWFDKKVSTEDGIMDLSKVEFDKAIICSTTETHYDYCRQMIDLEKPFLCEKPLSKSLEECEDLADRDVKYLGNVVCNYSLISRFFSDFFEGPLIIEYDYYNPGKDHILWDGCQLIYLDKNAKLSNRSPVWKLKMGGSEIMYSLVERSYIWMVGFFLQGTPGILWNLRDGYAMTDSVYRRIERECHDRTPSEKQIH